VAPTANTMSRQETILVDGSRTSKRKKMQQRIIWTALAATAFVHASPIWKCVTRPLHCWIPLSSYKYKKVEHKIIMKMECTFRWTWDVLGERRKAAILIDHQHNQRVLIIFMIVSCYKYKSSRPGILIFNATAFGGT
jgi:hypothetical protein